MIAGSGLRRLRARKAASQMAAYMTSERSSRTSALAATSSGKTSRA